jgi:hypothetical protein
MSHKDLVQTLVERERSYRADELHRYTEAHKRKVISDELLAEQRRKLEEIESAQRWLRGVTQ